MSTHSKAIAHLTLVLTLLFTLAARAELVTQEVDYSDGPTQLRGFLVYDDAVKGQRPGVMVVHEWWGLNDFARQQARDLAQMGYIAFAVDMYGQGKSTTQPSEAAAWSSELRKDPAVWRQRAAAGLEVLREHPLTAPRKIAAIGFCFGGSTVLELAYSGTDFSAAVSFHGNLIAPTPEEAAAIRPSLLILHGASDPHVPDGQVHDFVTALRASTVDWQLIMLGNAVHAFMNPAAGAAGLPGVAYDARAAARAKTMVKAFFDEIFSKTP